MDISVIIVTYNSKSAVGSCLDSLKRQNMFGSTEVIVVDNASTDGTAEFVMERHPWVDLQANHKNVGFSVGVNLGLQRASGRYFLILNPDTVVREDSIQLLYEFMEKTPDAGIAGPRLVFHDGNLQYSCRRFYNWRVLIMRRTFLGKLFKNSAVVSDHLMLDFDHETTTKVDWVLGACMMVRREAVKSVGVLDERFFLYFEDVDWCYRMKQRGWAVYYYPDSIVVHAHARDSAQKVFNRPFMAHLASLVRYYEKWNVVLYFLKKYREAIKVTLFFVIDLIAFIAGFLSSYYTRAALAELLPRPLFALHTYEQFVIYEVLTFVVTFLVLGLYRIRRDTSAVDELFAIGKAVILASVLLMASTYLSQIHSYSRLMVAFLVPYVILYTWLLRGMLRRFHRGLLAHKIDLKRVCIVGPANEARRLGEELAADRQRGIDVVGIIGTDLEETAPRENLGTVDDLSEIVDEFRVQELIFLPGAVAARRMPGFIELGRKRVLDITVLTDYTGLVMHHATMTQLAGRPAIAYRRDTRYAIDKLAKRLLDIAVGSAFLVVSIPFCVVYFLYATIRGRTPFSRELKLGLDGVPFTMPVAGVGSTNGPSDIVNLPLFWLVVTGKLSIVGPYPLPSAYDNMVGEVAGFRFDARPGVTGFWRVGDNDKISLMDLLAQDAAYTRNWSLSRDAKILAATFGSMVMGRKRILRLEHPSQG